MPGGTTEVGGNTKLQNILGFGTTGNTISSPSPNIAANTSVVSTYTVPGLLVGDLIDLQLQGHTAGLSIGSTWCATAGVLSVQWINSTTGTIASATVATVIQVTRFENANVAPIGTSPWLQAII